MKRTPTVNRVFVALLAMAGILLSGFSGRVLAQAAGTEQAIGQLTLVVPAAAGGGWDLTAQAARTVLMEEGLVDDVRIVYSPGAGGLIGLAQFVEGRRGDPQSILVSGMFTVGAAAPNRANVSLLDATPIARLTETGATIVVPGVSPIQSMEELILIFESRPDSILWIGGSMGGPDQMLLQSIAAALRVDSSQIHYRAYPGGADVGAALVAGKAAVGISDYSELENLIEAGHLRALAMSTENRLPRIPIPTLKEVGIDISLGNWRAVFAPPGISADEKSRLIELFDEMSRSEHWRNTLVQHHWSNAFLPGDDFERFVRSQYDVVRVLPDISATAPPPTGSYLLRIAWRHYWWALIIVFVLVAYASHALHGRRRASRHLRELEEALGLATDDAQRKSEQLEEALHGRMQRIEEDFDKWGLSAAEREIALLLLKGLRLQDIADVRQTSERTVRQQAQSIYRKSSLDSRTELSAYFMEDFLHSMDLADREVH